MPLPEKIKNAPTLTLGLQLYYSAFTELTTCRPIGNFGEGPISWIAVTTWADVNDVWGEQREELHYHIQKMDEVYLKYKAAQIEKQMKKK